MFPFFCDTLYGLATLECSFVISRHDARIDSPTCTLHPPPAHTGPCALQPARLTVRVSPFELFTISSSIPISNLPSASIALRKVPRFYILTVRQ